MTPAPLRVTLIQSNLHWENSEANLSMFTQKIASIEDHTHLIILPEMFTTGFSMKPELAEQMNGRSIEWMRQTAATKQCVLTGSLIIREGTNLYNRLIWMQPDGSFQHYDKRHLFSLSTEPNVFTPGTKRLIVSLNGWNICPLICYDLRFPVWCRNANDYDLLLFVANWPQRRSSAWKTLLQARAIENQSYVIGVNRVGVNDRDGYHSGDSSAFAAIGSCLFQQADSETITTLELDYQQLLETRNRLPFLQDADTFTIQTNQK